MHLFGEIVDGEMSSSPSGEMVLRAWNEIPAAYPGVEIDAFVVMPNHVHGIVHLLPTEQDLYPTTAPIDAPTRSPDDARPGGERWFSLFGVVERYRSSTSKRYGDGVRNDRWTPYPEKLWQRGYYERVVRNEGELDKFRRYIEGNPARWFEDPYRG